MIFLSGLLCAILRAMKTTWGVVLSAVLIATSGCASTDSSERELQASERLYGSCAEAAAAGATPLFAGQPGYDPQLDRDGNGIACERVEAPENDEPEPLPGGTDLAATVESDLENAFGVDTLTQTCGTAAGWPCFVNGIVEPSPGNVVVTIQTTGAEADELGRQAARAIWTLVPTTTSDRMTLVQTVSAEGAPIDTVTRSEVPALN